jgi:hypothetical protein
MMNSSDLTALLGNPAFTAGLGLLSAGRDRRIDPYQSAVQGLLTSGQFQQQQRQDQREDELFGLKKQQAEAGQLALQNRQAALAQVQGLLAKGDQAGAGQAAIGSGDPDLIRLGSGLLAPKTSQNPASIKEYEYLQKLLKDDPEAAARYQSILQPPRSAYFQGQTVYDSKGNIVPLNFDTRTGKWALGDIAGYTQPGALPNMPAPRPSGPLLPAGSNPKVVADKTAAETEARTTTEAQSKRDFNMGGVTDIVDQADAILSGETKPTSSRIGTAIDTAAALIGRAPEGAAQADQLKVLGGYLVSKMPRMEGPQSDKDVEVYRQMAADVGNSSLPIERRQAALTTLRGIVSKYDKAAGNSQSPSNGGWGIKKLQ